VTGTLPTANGGTNLTSFTSGGVVYASSSSALATGSALTFDGSKLDVNCGTNSEVRVTTSGSGYLQVGQFTNGAFIGTSSTDATAGILRFGTGGTTRATLDSAGNLGLGVTPSAWSTTYNKAIQLPAGSISAYTTIAVSMNQNAYYSGSAFNYVNNGFAERYEQYNGTHAWYTAASGTAGDAISFTQAMTLDASGNLGVGTTSPQATIVAAGSNATVYKAMILRNGNGTDGSSATIDFETSSGTQGSEAAMAGRIAGLRTGSGTSGALTFSTTNAGVLGERARIDSSGNLLVGTTSAATGYKMYLAPSGSFNFGIYYKSDVNDTNAMDFRNTSNTQVGSIYVASSSTTYATSSDYRHQCLSIRISSSIGTCRQSGT